MTIKHTYKELSQEQLNQYNRDSYLILRNFFTDEEVKTFKTCTARLAESVPLLWSVRETPEGDLPKGKYKIVKIEGDCTYHFDYMCARFVLNKEGIARVSWAGGAEYELLKLGRTSKLREIARQILNRKLASHLINQWHPKTAGSNVEYYAHQDQQHRETFDPEWHDPEGNMFVQMLGAMDDMGLENGTLEIYPGSHKRGYLRLNKLSDQEKQKVILNLGEPIPLELKRGDLLLMGPLLVHFSKPNKSSEPRDFFINGYCAVEARGAHPGDYPGIGSGQMVDLFD